MDLMLLPLSVGVLVFFLIFGTTYLLTGGTKHVQQHRLIAVGGEKARVDWRHASLSRLERIFKPLGEMVPRSPAEMSRKERRLAQAGIRRRDATVLFYGVKVGICFTFFLLFMGSMRNNPILPLLLALFLGSLLPDIWLSGRIRARKKRIELALPEALDLAVICVEAGLPLDQSLTRIGQEMRSTDPDLSDELQLFNLEVNAGKRRSEALRNLAARTGVEDIKSLVAVLIQTERFGTSVAKSLRVFADTMRIKRRQRAEEQAAKMAVKIVVPLVFFIVPALFVVVLVPAVITVIREFLPSLTGP
ncbi:MAG TPA: type II secretion system F family protein [Acidobacteriota bacterium]|jgi:tight adherence protein C